MRVIYKYTLMPEQKQCLKLPIGSNILDVQPQNNDVVLWAIVDDATLLKEVWKINVELTGLSMLDNSIAENYLTTFQKDGLVFHVFVEKES